MEIVAKFTLLALIAVFANGMEKEQILNGIKPISDVLENIYKSSYEDDLQRFLHNLTDFADSITMLNGQFNDSDPIDQSIKSELEKIKNSFLVMESQYFDTYLSSMNEIVREKFEISIEDYVNHLQKCFVRFIESPDKSHKNELTQACNATNGVKDALTRLHIELVNNDGNNDTFNQLMDGGVSLKEKLIIIHTESYSIFWDSL